MIILKPGRGIKRKINYRSIFPTNIDAKLPKNRSANRVHENIGRKKKRKYRKNNRSPSRRVNFRKERFVQHSKMYIYIIHCMNGVKKVILSYQEINKNHLKTFNIG